MSLVTLSGDGGAAGGFFGRRQTAALTVLVSSAGSELLPHAQHVTSNVVVIWGLSHGVVVGSAAWMSLEVGLGFLDRRYKRNPGTAAASEARAEVSDLDRARREHAEGDEGVGEHGPRSA